MLSTNAILVIALIAFLYWNRSSSKEHYEISRCQRERNCYNKCKKKRSRFVLLDCNDNCMCLDVPQAGAVRV